MARRIFLQISIELYTLSQTIESSEPGQRPTRAPLKPITSPIAGLFAGVENWEDVLSWYMLLANQSFRLHWLESTLTSVNGTPPLQSKKGDPSDPPQFYNATVDVNGRIRWSGSTAR